MIPVTNDIRQKYVDLKTKADAAYEAAEPQRKAYDEALKPWHDLSSQIEELLEGAEVSACESCLSPIFEGDKTSSTTDGILCLDCSPTYADIANSPGHFQNADDEPMTDAEAKAFVDAHLAEGGSLDDSLAT